jgi:hypothetical protein
MFLPLGQGVASASAGCSAVLAGVGHVSHEKPVLRRPRRQNIDIRVENFNRSHNHHKQRHDEFRHDVRHDDVKDDDVKDDDVKDDDVKHDDVKDDDVKHDDFKDHKPSDDDQHWW